MVGASRKWPVSVPRDYSVDLPCVLSVSIALDVLVMMSALLDPVMLLKVEILWS